MKSEKYEPTPEDYKNAKESMTLEQKLSSWEREFKLNESDKEKIREIYHGEENESWDERNTRQKYLESFIHVGEAYAKNYANGILLGEAYNKNDKKTEDRVKKNYDELHDLARAEWMKRMLELNGYPSNATEIYVQRYHVVGWGEGTHQVDRDDPPLKVKIDEIDFAMYKPTRVYEGRVVFKRNLGDNARIVESPEGKK